MYVYVISKSGKPLMPCKPAKARKLLKSGRAKCIKRTPFTIKLLFDCEENVQEVIAGMDTGSKTIGIACISNGKVVYQSETILRNDIKIKMDRRRKYRRTRRGRKCRYRKPRWSNRASMRRKDRLSPTLKSKLESHLKEKKFIESILSVSKWKLELVSFDIHKISNSDVKDYQNGELKGFYNVKSFVLNRDNYKCQYCKGKSRDKKLHVHHIIWRKKGGSDHQSNLITVCETCHKLIHEEKIILNLKGHRTKTKHATEMGILKSQLKKKFGEFEETFGYETKFKREQILKLDKTHYNDAIAICCDKGEIVSFLNNLLIKKCVSNGDYQQTKGVRSEKKIPTGKLFGFRKFDKIKTPEGIGFIKGKRSSGAFVISDILGNGFSRSWNAKNNLKRLSSRKSIIKEVTAIPPCHKEHGFLARENL